MGACTQKMKKLHKEAVEKKLSERVIKHSKTQSMQTQESVQDKDRKPKSSEKLVRYETGLNFDHTIILQTCKLSKCYSIMQSNKVQEGIEALPKQMQEGVQIVQHNLTGRVRTMETLNKYDNRATKYVEFLMNNQLTHPNLSQVHEIFQEDNELLIIQDYCSGGKLSTLAVKQGQGLEEHIALKVLIQMIEALNYIHSKKYTHGHLTFSSFLKIDESQTVYIKLVDIKPIFLKTNLTFEQLSYAAPEIIDNEQEYTISRDVWSIGVIFYKLLTGNLPYSGNTAQKLRSEIKKGVMQFQELSFDKISTRAKDLLSKLLQRNPAMRSDLGSLVRMPLYRKIVSQTKQISKQTVGMLTNVKSANPIQTLFLQFLVNQFCQNQQQEINQMFNKYDQNGDAKLNKNEIFELLYEQLKSKDMAKQHVDHIFKAVDTDHNGTIDCHEFIRCIIDRQALITTPNLKIVFKMISNGRGVITKKRFMQCFQVNQQQTDEMWVTVTKTKRITFKVFSRIMMELI